VGFAVPRDSLTIEGEVQRHVSLSASGHDAWRALCPRCGTPLFAGSSRNQAFVAVKVGSLDDPSACEPSLQLWSESAQPWTCVLPELPAFPRQPGWRTSSLAHPRLQRPFIHRSAKSAPAAAAKISQPRRLSSPAPFCGSGKRTSRMSPLSPSTSSTPSSPKASWYSSS
jgi:Glutathione-dependent formaldehyde-activating enzyme